MGTTIIKSDGKNLSFETSEEVIVQPEPVDGVEISGLDKRKELVTIKSISNGGNTMNIIIDRFEGNFVIVELEDKRMINMPIELVPAEAKEGDILEIQVALDKTEELRKKIGKEVEGLWE